MPADDQLLGNFQNGERGQAQKVELDQADRLHVVLVVLAHRRLAARLLVERTEVGQLAGRDQHAAGVHADVARQAFQLLRQLDQRAHLVFLAIALGQQWLDLHGALDGDVLARLVGDQLADAVAEGVAHVQHTPDVADRRARRHGAEGGDLAHRVLAVLALDVVDHAVAVGLAKVDVEVGHRHSLGVQEAFEQQLILQGIEVGDLQRIGHQRSRARATPRPHRATVVLGPVDEVAHDQEVTRKAHLQDGVDLEFEALQVTRPLGSALRGVGVQVRQPLLQAVDGGLPEIGFHRVALRYREVRQSRLAQHQRQAAAPRDLHRVGQRRGQIGEQRLHLGRGLEVLLRREAAHTARIAQDFALGDAHPRLVRFVIVGGGELHRMRGHHGQSEPCRQLHGGGHVRLVIGATGALQLQVEAVGKPLGQSQRDLAGQLDIALQQRLPHRAGLRARQQDQALGQLFEPGPAHHGLALDHALGPGTRQQLRQVQVALGMSCQQQHAGRRVLLGIAPFQQHLGADDRFDTRATRRLVELDGTEQVAEIGNRQSRLPITGSGLDDVVDACRAVNDGKLGVQAQVNEHGPHCRPSHKRETPRGPFHAGSAARVCGSRGTGAVRRARHAGRRYPCGVRCVARPGSARRHPRRQSPANRRPRPGSW